jgi:hypothetical protein
MDMSRCTWLQDAMGPSQNAGCGTQNGKVRVKHHYKSSLFWGYIYNIYIYIIYYISYFEATNTVAEQCKMEEFQRVHQQFSALLLCI